MKDRIDASFQKAHKWKLTNKQNNFNDLLSGADSKLFASSKSENHCLHHMLPLHHSINQVILHPKGHSLLWSPYGIGQTIIFSSCRLFFFFLSFFLA